MPEFVELRIFIHQTAIGTHEDDDPERASQAIGEVASCRYACPGRQARPEGKTLEEQVEHYRDLYESIKSKYQGARAELRKLRRDNTILLRRVEQLERALTRTQKTLQAVLEDRTRDPGRSPQRASA